MKNDLSASLVSLGAASHILSLGEEAIVRQYPDRVVISTPSQPDYLWGNFLLLRGPARDPEAQPAQFKADFPDASHVALLWDDIAAQPSCEDAAFEARGFNLNRLDVLSHAGAIPASPVPEGIHLRTLDTDADWAMATELQCQSEMEGGGNAAEITGRVVRRMASRRCSAQKNHLIWFGAFEGDVLVADAGVILASRFRRFQAVETRSSHRRRGIAAALVSHASQIIDRPVGCAQLIIAAAGSDASRLYHRLGFVVTEHLIAATWTGERCQPS